MAPRRPAAQTRLEVIDDTEYLATLTALCQGSVRRHFHAYGDIDWDDPAFSVTPERPALTLRRAPTRWAGIRGTGRSRAATNRSRSDWPDRRTSPKWRHSSRASSSAACSGMRSGCSDRSPEFRYCVHEPSKSAITHDDVPGDGEPHRR